MARKFSEIMRNVFIVCASVLITLVLLEVGLRYYLVNHAQQKTFFKYASLSQLKDYIADRKTRYEPHRYIGYIPTPNYVDGPNRHNSLGFRGDEIIVPKPLGKFRIVCIGGSTTYTSELKDYRKSYPYLLQQFLHQEGYSEVEVVNAGAGSWSSWESLINFQLRALDLNPDMIIIYHSINDIHPRMVWPPEVYRGDNSGSRIASTGNIFMPSIFEYSTLFRIFMIRAGIATPHASLERTTDNRPDTYYARQFRTQKKNNTYPNGVFKQVSAKQILKTNKPIYFERNIRSMISIAKDNGIGVVLSTFAYSRHFPDKPIVASEEYQSAFKENNALLKNIAKDARVNIFDFANQFPDKKEYYTDGRHVTESGSRKKARLFGEYLISNKLIP